MIDITRAAGLLALQDQECFALDPRLTPGVHP